MDELLPSKLIPVVTERSRIPAEKAVHEITREERRQLAVRSSINPQRSAGGDVISRIAYAGKSRENAWELQRLLVEKMDELARDHRPGFRPGE